MNKIQWFMMSTHLLIIGVGLCFTTNYTNSVYMLPEIYIKNAMYQMYGTISISMAIAFFCCGLCEPIWWKK